MMSSSALFARVLAGVVLINLFVIGLAGLSLRQSYQQFQERAEITTRNLAQVLENNISGIIRTDDIALFDIIAEYQQQHASGSIDVTALNAHIEQVRMRLPEIDALRITDAQGVLKYGTGVAPGNKTSLADRRHFIRLRENPKAGLVISQPQVSRVNQKWVVVLARRINLPDGTFGGMAFAAIALEHLSHSFAAINVGRHGSISLRDGDLCIVEFHANTPHDHIQTGQRIVPEPLLQLRQSGAKSGSFHAVSPSDKIERSYTYRQIADSPLSITVGLAGKDYLDEWRKLASRLVALVVMFALITLAAAWLIYRDWKRQAHSVKILAEQEAKLRTVADFTHDWEYWQGPNQEILYMTPSCERVTGYSPTEFAADPGLLLRVIHPEDRHLMEQHLHDINYHDGSLVDFRIVRRDGAIRCIAHHCRAVTGLNGEPRGRRVSNRDVTEQKQAENTLREKTEALMRSNTDLEQFAYSISHDMRQPLRMVTGHLQLLERGLKDTLDQDNRENLAFALDGARRMDAMIVSLLDYSRIGRKTGSKQWLASRASLDEALDFLAPAIEESRADISVTGEWPRVFANRDELTRLFQNLVGNAVKYHPAEQAPQIEVVSSTTSQFWRVSVRDHGIGIAPQQIERLFQFFSRLQSRARFEGTGMGLALCRRITENHAGRIWVESEGEGLGSNFIFEIPLNPADATTSDNEPDGHGNGANPNDEIHHAHFPLPNPPPAFGCAQATTGEEGSLREIHIKGRPA